MRVTLDEVLFSCDGIDVGQHRRFLGHHQNLLLADHVRAMRAIRAEDALAATPAIDTEVEQRALTVYDRIVEVG